MEQVWRNRADQICSTALFANADLWLCPYPEADIILLSLCRSTEGGNIGFLRRMNRINVMLSRARHGMYIFGNAECMRASPGGAWAKVLQVMDDVSASKQPPPHCFNVGSLTAPVTTSIMRVRSESCRAVPPAALRAAC